MIDYISAYKSQVVFMGLDFEADKSRMKGELRVMMNELYLKWNCTELKTIPRDIFIWDKTSHVKEN